MVTVWRPLALATAFLAASGVASAQTVVVQNVPPAAAVELIVNGSGPAKATAGQDGLATLAAPEGAVETGQALDVLIWVDECGSMRRIVIMTRTLQPPPADGCRRSAVTGLFLLQRITSLLVDVGTVSPTVRLRQGPLPEAWLLPPAPVGAPSEPSRAIAPAGVILFGAAGLTFSGDLLAPACGDVTTCSRDDQVIAVTAGVGYWFTPYVGAEGSYFRPFSASATGSGDRYRFDSEADGGMVTIVGKGGVPFGRMRIFGTGGANYHRATFTTTERIDTFPVTLQWRTEGWGLVFGGGAEVWINESFAIYGEFTRAMMTGEDVRNTEATTDAPITSIVVGGRYRFRGF